MARSFQFTQDEKNAQAVLAKLGFRSESTILPNRMCFQHSIYEATTGRLRWASIHPDIFLSMAITVTLDRMERREV